MGHCTHTAGSANIYSYRTYVKGEITLHVAQAVNTEQLQHCVQSKKVLSQCLTNLMHKICFTISFYFMPLHVSSTCAHHQEVKIALLSLWYHHTYRCDDTRGCVMQFVHQVG